MVVGPQLCFATLELFYFLALVVRPSPYRYLFIVPIVFAVISFFRSALQYQSTSEYTFACLLVVRFFAATDHILLTDVQRELFEKGQKQPACRLPLFGRLKWAASLYVGCRGVGWNYEPTHALPRRSSPSTTRSGFVLQELRYFAWDLAAFEALTTYTKNSSSFATNGHSIASDGAFWLAVNVIIYGLCASVSLDMPHRMLGILCVALGITEPQEWVPLFGSPYDAYSLRNFWGCVWHQILRREIISHGRFIAYDISHLRKKSLEALLVQVYVGFTISALIHLAGEYSILGRWTYHHALRFFALQAVGVTIEVIIIETARKFSTKRSWHWIGYPWVLAWFMYTLPGWVDPLFRSGMAEVTSNFGILDALLKQAQWL